MNPKKTLLLHSCCAPCSTTVIEQLKSEYDITIFFYNPNIIPFSEYKKRLDEQKRFLENAHPDIKIIEGEYKQNNRPPNCCEECFLNRLEKTAMLASEMGFSLFTTTLTTGSKKKADIINPIAAAVGGRYNIKPILSDFKKKNGYNRSIELSKKYNLYRQDYCGCKIEPRDRAFK